MGDRYSDLVFDKILEAPFVPWALETLEACRALEAPVFVISGTPHEELVRIIEGRGMQRFFTEVWGSPAEKAAALRTIRASYGLASAEVLAVGDGRFDWHAAQSEGVPFVARESGAENIDWASYGVPSVPDLKPIAELALCGTVRIPSEDDRVPEVTLALGPRIPRQRR